MPIVITGNKYFNNGSQLGSIREAKQFMATMPEITTMSGGNPIADNHNSIQPI
jgi:hypothetical protein